ncbi:DUF397 domain-containing protein [Nocardia cyriacigeorgica]|uniref:DUF397 domain-containing protein n=1 Tax=Nocardia cyriacigeorgica TaxID=135487 RepID=UPI001893297B|nr:DUF397 domain-containing protein [Nocardia cyriacigeorgica]MBF6290150.1 DUF397 domain-containing protein [Nocardia cyriacigeorgica]
MNVDLSRAHWFKSSRSAGGTECVEVAHLNYDLVGVRDSKNPSGPALIFTPTAWDSFTTTIQQHRFPHHA